MSRKLALQIILGLALFGMCFSGYLSYTELWGHAATSCPTLGGAPGTVLGYPACVYGFFMFLIVATIALLGLTAKEGPKPPEQK